MFRTIVLGLVFLVFGIIMYMSYIVPDCAKPVKQKEIHKNLFILFMALGVLARYIAAAFYEGHPTDMNCFSAWAQRVYENGFGGFYSADTFTDYPPGYMYVLWLLGAVRNIFSFSQNAFYVLLKTPAIVCDMLIAYLLYRISDKQLGGSAAVCVPAMWIFNPAAFINSAVWGQVDSVFTLLVFICMIMLAKDRLVPSFFVFAAAVMIKPQSLFYTPLFIFAVVQNAVYPVFDLKKLLKYILGGLGAVMAMVISALPFGLSKVIAQYTETLSSYQYCSVNAYNLWAALGLNWAKLTSAVSAAGMVAIAAIVFASGVMFFKSKEKSKYFWIAGFICFSTFMFAHKMHDRYAYPAMLMLIAAFAVCRKKEIFWAYLAVSLTQFFNAAYALFYYDAATYHTSSQPAAAVVFGIFAAAAYAVLVYAAVRYFSKGEMNMKKSRTVKKQTPKMRILRSDKGGVFTKTDALILIVLMAVYSCIAFYNLGDTKAPQSGVTLANESLTLDIDAKDGISEFKLFLGAYNLKEDNTLTLRFSDNGEQTLVKELDSGSVFCWNNYGLAVDKADSVTIEANGEVMLLEAAFFDENKAQIEMSESALFDEQELVPERTTYKNSTYFDEIYHARTAYEFIHKLPVFEWTHPPLGKVFISLGVRAFGMTPFGWRVVGTLFGVLMIPAIYVFAKKMFKSTLAAAFGTALFTFDFMHFAQTRIATIDVYITFFIILMYAFMLMYFNKSFYDTDFKKTLVPLGLCGVCFGLGTASKWTGLYAGAGLAVLFLIYMLERYSEYSYALKNPRGETDGIRHDYIISVFPKYARNTVIFCVVMFVVVPAAIYLLSYIPFAASNGTGFSGIIKNQGDMFRYHKGVTESHSFASEWYKWPIMYRPIWYYSGAVSDTVKEGISSFGNPLVWWVGIPAFFYTAYCAFAKKERGALFLTVGYLAELLPWIPVTRVTFIYHYFPCVPFVVMMIVYSAMKLIKSPKNRAAVMAVYAFGAVILFAMFYPVLSGYPVPVSYVSKFLKWSAQWVLMSGA